MLSTILWIILIGFIAGVIARLISPGPNNPSGFLLTTLLGVAGAFLATWLGQLVGWYRPDQGARFIGATVGALIILFIWNRLVAHGVIGNRGDQHRLR
ncbi:MAG: GlsB/YeaQ/YmgE family stress response membrane protein [Bradyrhizobiaceae bacterium]|nr:GlsB/YeaQ/YmgE family stress response membrane protein [Bradyrhizobiaceae bacterium]